LPWPATKPATLDAAVHQRVRETFPESSSDVAVAISYVPDLMRISYEEPGPESEGLSGVDDDPWLKAIRRGLAPYVSVPGNCDALYGRSTLDNWLLAQDGKTDQLQLTGDRFVLLDASACLGGVSWSIAEQAATAAPRPYSGRGRSTYTRAVIDTAQPYERWLALVANYPEQHLEDCLKWARSWSSGQRLDLVRSIVLPTDRFVQHFRGVLRGDFFTWPGRS